MHLIYASKESFLNKTSLKTSKERVFMILNKKAVTLLLLVIAFSLFSSLAFSGTLALKASCSSDSDCSTGMVCKAYASQTTGAGYQQLPKTCMYKSCSGVASANCGCPSGSDPYAYCTSGQKCDPFEGCLSADLSSLSRCSQLGNVLDSKCRCEAVRPYQACSPGQKCDATRGCTGAASVTSTAPVVQPAAVVPTAPRNTERRDAPQAATTTPVVGKVPQGGKCSVDSDCETDKGFVCRKLVSLAYPTCGLAKAGVGMTCMHDSECDVGLVCGRLPGEAMETCRNPKYEPYFGTSRDAPPKNEAEANVVMKTGVGGKCVDDANCDAGFVCRRYIGERTETCHYPLCDLGKTNTYRCECTNFGICSIGQICMKGGCQNPGTAGCTQDTECTAPLKCLKVADARAPSGFSNVCDLDYCPQNSPATTQCTCNTKGLRCNHGETCTEVQGKFTCITSKKVLKAAGCTPTTCSVITVKLSGPGHSGTMVKAGNPARINPKDKYSVLISATKQETTAACLEINGKKYSGRSKSFTIWVEDGKDWSFKVQGYSDGNCAEGTELNTARATVKFFAKSEEKEKQDKANLNMEQADAQFKMFQQEYERLRTKAANPAISPKDRQQVFEDAKVLRQELASLLDWVKGQQK